MTTRIGNVVTHTVTLPPGLTSQEFADIINSAKKCDNPAVAAVTLNSSFRYGCFCGANYPEIPVDIAAINNPKSPEEVGSLLKWYYSILPIDDIDMACRKHDICYLVNDRPDYGCTDAFSDELNEVRRKIYSRISWFNYDTEERRCNTMILDMMASTQTVFFPGESDSPFISLMKAFRRAYATVFYGAIMGIFRPPVWSISNPYPKKSERCFA